MILGLPHYSIHYYFRYNSIKMCTKVVLDDLVTLHHEMGHNEYQHLYSDLPMPFRDGANNGNLLVELVFCILFK